MEKLPSAGVSRGLGQNSLRGGVHTALPGRAGAPSPLPLAASMALFRSRIHFSFSRRVLGGAGHGAELACRARTVSRDRGPTYLVGPEDFQECGW